MGTDINNTKKQSILKNKSQINCLYTNIRSLTRNFDQLTLLLAKYNQNSEIDIIALTETWISEDKLKLFEISGYKAFIQSRKDGRRSGGVVVYIKTHLKIKTVENISLITGNMMKLQIETDATDEMGKNVITIIVIYRDCTSSKNTFINELENAIDNGEKNVILLGDINIDIMNEREAKDYLNTVRSFGYDSKLNIPTRDDRCLDHVMVKATNRNINKCMQVQAEILEEMITDHAVIMLNVDVERQYVKTTINTGYTVIDQKKLTSNINNINWSEVLGCDEKESVNNKLMRMITAIHRAQEKAQKVISLKDKQQETKNVKQPWATPALIQLIRTKSAAYKQHRKNRENEELKKYFKLISNITKKEIRRAKVEYFSKLLEENKRNPAKFWKIVNGVRGDKKESPVKEIKVNNEIIDSETQAKKVANHFNSYFNEVPEKLLKEQNLLKDAIKQKYCKINEKTSNQCTPGLKNFSLTEADIEQAIKNLKNKKSTGHDRISLSIIKNNKTVLIPALTELYNISLKQGTFPDTLKTAVIVPIFKKGDPQDIVNYRPISLLPTVSKILESCVKDKILNYLNHIKYFSWQQFGFMKKKSTDMALFQHIRDIVEGIEMNNVTVGLYLDLAKAFDTVHHERLIAKLSAIGFQDKILSWFKTYLENRTHMVKINEDLSDSLTLNYGVPQGSVLGPILFNIYINDMFQLPLRGKIIGYADDTSVLYSEKNYNDIIEAFNHDRELLLPWFKENMLHLNVEKCQYVIYAYKTPAWQNEFRLYFKEGKKENEISRVEKMKYLGLWLDSKLTWKEHSIYLQERLRKLNYLFYHFRNYFNEKHLKTLYRALYESTMTYGIIHWGASCHTKAIKVLQNRVCRTILNLHKRTSESEIYEKMNVLELKKLYKKRLLIFVFKNKTMYEIYDTVTTHSRTGGGFVSAYPKWKKTHSRLQARYTGCSYFNKLSPACRNERSIGKYKKMIV